MSTPSVREVRTVTRDPDSLIRDMRLAIRSDVVSEWERKFCASIIKQDWKGFTPSARQIVVMDRIARKFWDAVRAADASEVIE